METIIKVTSINLTNMPDGMRLTYTYSKIDSAGTILASNEKGSMVVLDDMSVQLGEADEDLLSVINAVYAFVQARLN